ncbi:MAG: hypothetical protein JST35_00735 [Armatimonadetes bacterium]|nr:hypothetical protein [Armatimonadota bacterium]
MSTVPVSRPFPRMREPYVQTPVKVRARRVAKARSRSKSHVAILANLIAFGAVVGVAFVATSLLGHVMVEKARRQNSLALSRLSAAKTAMGPLKLAITTYNDPREIAKWSEGHGYAPASFASTSKEQEHAN